MGVGFQGRASSSSFDNRINTIVSAGNPDPKVYTVLNYVEHGKMLVLKIKYPNCTNYEGTKILVFKNVKFLNIVNQRVIDPHFSENKTLHSPIARFVPTEEGWSMALNFAKGLS